MSVYGDTHPEMKGRASSSKPLCLFLLTSGLDREFTWREMRPQMVHKHCKDRFFEHSDPKCFFVPH